MKYIPFLSIIFMTCVGVLSINAQTHTLDPLADVYYENGASTNNNILKLRNVNKSRAYLRFDLTGLSSNIQSAQLKLTLKSNEGVGAVNIYECPNASSNWTSFNSSTVPSFDKPTDQLNTNVVDQLTTRNQTYIWNLDEGKLSTGGSLTIAVKKAVNISNVFYSTNHSSSHYHPQLIITTGGAAPTCSDGIQNGDETGVDCGGSNCAACPTAPTCSDGIQNGNETGVDCGGDCADCPPAPPTCDDGIQNGDETGVDCGGSDCTACPTTGGGESVWTQNGSVIYYNGGNVGIGTTTPTAKLTVAGQVLAQRVTVTETAGGADFVFEPDYDLPPLSEVPTFIKEHKHLPEIPSAQEMEADGLDLATFNIQLLQKVEELTLYLIEIQQVNVEQAEELEKLRAELRELRERKEDK